MHDRLALALSVLDGEEGAHRILGDMLEEQGDRGMAAWARAKKGKRNKRIDFVLALLPHKMSLGLASDFLAHSFSLIDKFRVRLQQIGEHDRPSLAPAIHSVKAVSRWADGSVSLDKIEPHRAILHSVLPWSHGIQNVDKTMRHLLAALDYSIVADELANVDPRSSQHHANESRNASRKVAKAAREMTRPLSASHQWKTLPRSSSDSDPSSDELDSVAWQVEHTRAAISEQIA